MLNEETTPTFSHCSRFDPVSANTFTSCKAYVPHAPRTHVVSLLEHLFLKGDRIVGDHHLHIQIADLL